MIPHRCPVCEGSCVRPRAAWEPGEGPIPCQACRQTGVLWTFDPKSFLPCLVPSAPPPVAPEPVPYAPSPWPLGIPWWFGEVICSKDLQ